MDNSAQRRLSYASAANAAPGSIWAQGQQLPPTLAATIRARFQAKSSMGNK
jgi:hypothetical protein